MTAINSTYRVPANGSVSWINLAPRGAQSVLSGNQSAQLQGPDGKTPADQSLETQPCSTVLTLSPKLVLEAGHAPQRSYWSGMPFGLFREFPILVPRVPKFLLYNSIIDVINEKLFVGLGTGNYATQPNNVVFFQLGCVKSRQRCRQRFECFFNTWQLLRQSELTC